MSKDAANRAMREARYAARTGTKPPAPKPVAASGSADTLCGHRSMNGRSCTRELGHAAKSHRYG